MEKIQDPYSSWHVFEGRKMNTSYGVLDDIRNI